ncbi:MAG TPA: hypothetical protein VMY05_11465 [Acidobacteriota bacterium]|nr:hypothetical protein [Acidobacteriota bacterium]
MARADQAADLLRKGNSPSRIAAEMGITVASVKGYLYTKIGDGTISHSDIVFSIDAPIRDAIEDFISTSGITVPYRISQHLEKNGLQISKEEIEFYLRSRHEYLGDMYALIREFEVFLHRAIKRVLVKDFGEDNWWRSGVPVKVRKECVVRLEEDDEPADDPYCYTNLIHLLQILEKQRSTFSLVLPSNIARDKPGLKRSFNRLNRIRNAVMHPVRGEMPSDEDFSFVREFTAEMKMDKWRLE